MVAERAGRRCDLSLSPGARPEKTPPRHARQGARWPATKRAAYARTSGIPPAKHRSGIDEDRLIVAGSGRDSRVGGCRPAARWAAWRVFGGKRRWFRQELLDHARQNLPFAAPVVVAYQGPYALDDIGLRRRRVQMRRMTPALAPHRRLAVGWPRTSAIVVFAVDAFFHVIVAPRRDNVCDNRRLLSRSACSRVTCLFYRKFATLVACTCSDQRMNLKAD